jgi:hydrogenase maturation factor
VGRVSVGGARVEVAFDLLPEAKVGDSVLLHAGVALARLQDDGLEAGDNRRQEG